MTQQRNAATSAPAKQRTDEAETSIAVEQKGSRRSSLPSGSDRGASVIHQGPQDPHPDVVRKA